MRTWGRWAWVLALAVAAPAGDGEDFDKGLGKVRSYLQRRKAKKAARGARAR